MNTKIFVIFLDPRTYKGEVGDGCHPCNKVFSKFRKDNLVLVAEPFSDCSFILYGNIDISVVCPSFLTFPWQPLFSCSFGQNSTFLT